jgi:hypothetical protein
MIAAVHGSVTPGPVLFARFAYPPNSLGYCGPADSQALADYALAAVEDSGLHALARRFEGAWPYLALIAAATGHADPLDAAVVESYWIGTALLERIPARLFAANLDDRFAGRAGRHRADLEGLALLGGRAHHNFHVFGVYPWVGMLRAGRTEQPLRVLNSCRVRWGTVVSVDAAGGAIVRNRPLSWDGVGLSLGEPVLESVRAGLGLTVAPGDRVALHWDWLCDVLDERRLARLRHYTMTQLRLANESLGRPVAAPLFD